MEASQIHLNDIGVVDFYNKTVSEKQESLIIAVFQQHRGHAGCAVSKINIEFVFIIISNFHLLQDGHYVDTIHDVTHSIETVLQV